MDKEFVSDMSEEEEEHGGGGGDDSNGKSEPCSNIPLSTGRQQQRKEIPYGIWCGQEQDGCCQKYWELCVQGSRDCE